MNLSDSESDSLQGPYRVVFDGGDERDDFKWNAFKEFNVEAGEFASVSDAEESDDSVDSIESSPVPVPLLTRTMNEPKIPQSGRYKVITPQPECNDLNSWGRRLCYPKDQVQCDVCGSVFNRCTSNNHRKSKFHKDAVEANTRRILNTKPIHRRTKAQLALCPPKKKRVYPKKEYVKKGPSTVPGPHQNFYKKKQVIPTELNVNGC